LKTNRPFESRLKAAPGWIGAVLAGSVFGILFVLEKRRPLRSTVESRLPRVGRNLVLAGLGAVASRLCEAPLTLPLARLVERKRFGLLKRMRLPFWLEVAVGCALLDYTLYVWHVLTHKIPFLWRFHQVHHVDLDLDASSALRFHFGELALATPWRAAQVLVFGICPLSLSIWQTALLLEIMFHHSNWELPLAWERRLSRLIVTPRLHGIHHSMVKAETDSNWSSGLSIWDWLHGTLRSGVPQRAIRIGVPAYADASELDLPHLVRMPFGKQRISFPARNILKRDSACRIGGELAP
jgi:sterol desaturase/sphingolipid hydroxylase (fatty acid hydroxylase superfamily)